MISNYTHVVWLQIYLQWVNMSEHQYYTLVPKSAQVRYHGEADWEIPRFIMQWCLCQIRVRIHLNADVLLFIQERVIWQLMLSSCTMSCSLVPWSWGAKTLPWKRRQTRPFQREPQALFSAACPTAPTWPSERCSVTGSPAQLLTKR